MTSSFEGEHLFHSSAEILPREVLWALTTASAAIPGVGVDLGSDMQTWFSS